MDSLSSLERGTWTSAYTKLHTKTLPTPFKRQLQQNALYIACGIAALLWLLRFTVLSNRPHLNLHISTSPLPDIPHKIWQTWHHPASALGDEGDGELKDCVTSWSGKNPGYRYELLTDSASTKWVHEAFAAEPQVVETWDRIDDAILRADFVRYLLMLKEGGVYTDVDTLATRPIDTWIPPEYVNTTKCVVGLEEDRTMNPTIDGDEPLIGLCQWTLMAAPGHPLMRYVVDRVTAKLLERVGEGGKIVGGSAMDVLGMTGPDIFRPTVLEALSLFQGSNVTESDLTGLQAPKQFGDVLVLTVSAFASGQEKSGSKNWGNEEQLLEHRWRGSWLQKHPWR